MYMYMYLNWLGSVIVKLLPFYRHRSQCRLKCLCQLTFDLSLPSRLRLCIEKLLTPGTDSGHGSQEVTVSSRAVGHSTIVIHTCTHIQKFFSGIWGWKQTRLQLLIVDRVQQYTCTPHNSHTSPVLLHGANMRLECDLWCQLEAT